MNKSFIKLLQSCAGVLLLSTAGLSMAATYDYDFDGDENERGGQPLSFGDLDVKGYTDGDGKLCLSGFGHIWLAWVFVMAQFFLALQVLTTSVRRLLVQIRELRTITCS